MSNKTKHRPRTHTYRGVVGTKKFPVIGADYSTLKIGGHKNPMVNGHSNGRFAWIMLRKL